MKKKLLVTQLILFLLTAIELISISTINASQFIVDILKVQLLLFYIWTIYSSRKILNFKWTNLYILFLISLGIFIYSRIFLDIFNLYDFSYESHFLKVYFSIDTQEEILIYLLISIITIHFGAILALGIKVSSGTILGHNANIEKIGTILFYIGLPGTITKSLIQLKYILTYGYLMAYTGMDNLHYPFWTKGSGLLFLFGFVFILASLPRRKKALFVILIFMFVKLILLLRGARGDFIVSLFFVLWYYYYFISVKDLKMSLALISASLLIILTQFIGFFRDARIFEMNDFVEILTEFFTSRGMSMLVLGDMIHLKDTFVNNGIPYILSPFTELFSPSSQGLDRLQRTDALADKLSYALAPGRYLSGEGLGTSFLGELYDLGLIGFTFGNFLFGFLLIYFYKIVGQNRIALLLAFPIVYGIIWAPRGTYLPSIYNITIILIAYFIYLIMFNPTKKGNS